MSFKQKRQQFWMKEGTVLKVWTRGELELLQKLYLEKSNKELGVLLERSPSAVGTQLCKMGLKRGTRLWVCAGCGARELDDDLPDGWLHGIEVWCARCKKGRR